MVDRKSVSKVPPDNAASPFIKLAIVLVIVVGLAIYAFVALTGSQKSSPHQHAIGTTVTVNSLNRSILANRPVGYWPFDKVSSSMMAVDLTANHSDLTVVGHPVMDNVGPLAGSTTMTLNGKDQYAVDPTPSPAITTAHAWTLEMVINPATATQCPGGSNEGQVVGQYRGQWMYWSVGYCHGQLYLYDSNYTAPLSTVSVPASRWTQVIYSYSPGVSGNPPTVQVYVNGHLRSSGFVNALPPSSSIRMVVGRSFGYKSAYFAGSISDLAFYNRALSLSQLYGILLVRPIPVAGP